MATSTQHLRPDGLRTQTGVWVSAGLISQEQARYILAFEAGDGSVTALRPPTAAPLGAAPGPVGAPGRTALAVEVVAYLGAALIVAAVMGILGQTWEDVPLAGRLVLICGPAAAAAAAGWLLRARSGPLGRLASVLWLLACGGTAAFVALVCAEGTDLSPSASTTVTLGVVAPVAVLAWALQRRSLQMLAMVGTTTGLVAATMYQSGIESAATIGTVVAAVGLVWFVQARVPVLEPALAGTVAGLVAAYAGAQAISSVWPVAGTALVVVGAVALMGLSVVDRSTLELLMGAFALFTSLPQLMFEWFGDSIGAPLALLVCGLLLVLVALRVASTRRRSEQPRRPMSPSADS